MWPQAQLTEIIKQDDLHVSPFRDDGKTYGTPTWIWCVQVEGELYVRGYNGTRSRWYQSAIKQKAGRIFAAGKPFEVTFEVISDASLNEQVDDAYRAKYKQSSYLAPMISDRARAATVRIRLKG